MSNVSSSNSQKANVPKLQFNKNSKLWNEIFFSDAFEFLPNNTLSRSELTEYGTTKNIHYGDILIKYDNTLNGESEEIPYIKKNISYRESYLNDGDIVIADTAEDETVGKAIELYNITTNIVSGLHTIPCRPKVKFYSGYLGYYLNSFAYRKQLLPLMQGIKVLSLSKTNISKTLLRYPDILEQEKIANMFNLINKKISLQTRQIELLKSYKRGLLIHIFSEKNGWKKSMLKDIAEIYQPKTISSEDLIAEGRYPVYGANGMIGHYTEYNHENEQIAICCRGASCGTVNYIPAKSWITGNAMVINTDNYNVDKKFLYYQLTSNDLSYMISGSGQPQIVKKPCELHQIFLPDLDKQKYISNTLDSVELLLNNKEKLLNQLLQIKNALLQKMFI